MRFLSLLSILIYFQPILCNLCAYCSCNIPEKSLLCEITPDWYTFDDGGQMINDIFTNLVYTPTTPVQQFGSHAFISNIFFYQPSNTTINLLWPQHRDPNNLHTKNSTTTQFSTQFSTSNAPSSTTTGPIYTQTTAQPISTAPKSLVTMVFTGQTPQKRPNWTPVIATASIFAFLIF